MPSAIWQFHSNFRTRFDACPQCANSTRCQGCIRPPDSQGCDSALPSAGVSQTQGISRTRSPATSGSPANRSGGHRIPRGDRNRLATVIQFVSSRFGFYTFDSKIPDSRQYGRFGSDSPYGTQLRYRGVTELPYVPRSCHRGAPAPAATLPRGGGGHGPSCLGARSEVLAVSQPGIDAIPELPQNCPMHQRSVAGIPLSY